MIPPVRLHWAVETPFYKVSVNTLVGVECGEQGLPDIIVCSVTLDPVGHGPQEH
jgi:hypothetical protein